MNLDLSPLKDTVNGLAGLFAIYIGIVVIIGLVLVYLMQVLKVPLGISRPIATLGTLAAAYYSFIAMFD